MNLYEFFFPQFATIQHLKAIRQSQQENPQRLQAMAQAATDQALKKRLDDLESDMGLMVLVLTSLLSMLSEKGTLSREDFETELKSLDLIDGKADGRLNIRILKQYLAEKTANQNQ